MNVLIPKRRRVPLSVIRRAAGANLKLMTPTQTTMMMEVLKRESKRRTTYGCCTGCACGT